MKLLLAVLIWEAVFITVILISKTRTVSDKWLGVCIVSSVMAVSGVPFLLIAVTKMMDNPRPLWAGIGIGLVLLASLQVARVNNQDRVDSSEENF